MIKCKHPDCEEQCTYGFCSKECKNHYKMLDKRQNNKARAVEYLGGRCKRCGFNENISILHFHHLDPGDKKYNISEKLNRGFEFIQSELNKCILLCVNCHLIVHRTNDSNYFLINNYFFGYDFEKLERNLGIDNKDECTKLESEKGVIL